MRAVAALSLLFASWMLTLNSLKAEDLDVTCYSGGGSNYRGTVARTASGKTCQSWSVQTPHSHFLTPENRPCSGLENNNYCRTPNYPYDKKPMCYTTDPQQRAEHCDIPRCVGVPQPEPPELTCFTACGLNYRGTVSTTTSGRACQRWAVQTPHSHVMTLENFPHAGLENNNHCRNPYGKKKPWCHTTDPQKRWEYCDIPRCVPGVPQPAPMLPTADLHCGPPEVYRMNSIMISKLKTAYRPRARVLYDCMVGYTSTGGRPDVTCVAGKWTPLTLTCESLCGRLAVQTGTITAVLGGTPSRPGQHPWQVSLQRRAKGTSKAFGHACGGALIGSCWVLTAAHCIEPNNTMDMRVVIGGVDNGSDEEADQVIDVKRHFIHSDYWKETVTNDIALLQLSVTDDPYCAKETSYVKPACLPNKIFPDGKPCVISGWGSTNDATRTLKMSHGGVTVMAKDRCVLSMAYGDLRVDNTMICAEDKTGRVNFCTGDSGGPLVCKDSGVHYVSGLVSWVDISCSGQKPGVYAEVYRHVEWIATCIAHDGSQCRTLSVNEPDEYDYDY